MFDLNEELKSSLEENIDDWSTETCIEYTKQHPNCASPKLIRRLSRINRISRIVNLSKKNSNPNVHLSATLLHLSNETNKK